MSAMQALLDTDAAIESIIAAETEEAEFPGGMNGNHPPASAGFAISGKPLSGCIRTHQARQHFTHPKRPVVDPLYKIYTLGDCTGSTCMAL